MRKQESIIFKTPKDEEKIFDSSPICAIGGIAVAQSQEQALTLTELQAEKEKLEAKLAKVIEEKENAENSLVGKYKDVAFAFNKHISKKQKKFAKIVLRGAKRKEKRIKKELKRLNKRIEEISKLAN